MKKLINGSVLCILLLAGCAGYSDKTSLNENPSQSLAKLIDYRLDSRFIHIIVLSKGCTFTTSFELSRPNINKNELQIIRKIPDHCQSKPIKMSLTYSFRHLGIDPKQPVVVINQTITEKLAKLD